ncbi:MAG: hypothetical protein JWO92_447 [Chitinophagaceae bacterium]|nr:hypothetical protein [Chitinophagaceae bacterium]
MDLKKIFYKIRHWETWHYHVKYIPLYPMWLWYCLKARSIWFFTASNPTLTFGGFEGESKREMYDQLPISSYPKSIYISPSFSFQEVEKLFNENYFNYPVAVKPDVGMMGFMFRKIDNTAELKLYHATMQGEYIIQEFITSHMEVSVFYHRFPDQQKGTITGFLKKEVPEVIGDGKRSLAELIDRLALRPGFNITEWKAKHRIRLNEIIPAGEIYRLSIVANLSRGGKLISLANEKDERLLKVFDDLSNYAKHFYYGRYDIKCDSVDELKNGNFCILEYNGSGAEPHHIYGAGNNLMQAYKIILHHWKVLYKISRYNHQQGISYWKFSEGYRFLKGAKKYFARLKQLDSETV